MSVEKRKSKKKNLPLFVGLNAQEPIWTKKVYYAWGHKTLGVEQNRPKPITFVGGPGHYCRSTVGYYIDLSDKIFPMHVRAGGKFQ